MKKIYLTVILLMTIAASCDLKTDAGENQTHENHDSHTAKINEQGDRTMGFSHQKTTHHFRLFSDGGAIEVTANETADAESRDQIRQHLTHIEQVFSNGNFDAPMLTHGKIPPGVPTLQKLKNENSYKYEKIEGGGRVKIATQNTEALAAIHEFLRFQIADHQTGDQTVIINE